MESTQPAPVINWSLAASTAARLSRGGPKTNIRQARDETRGLRAAAEESVEHVYRLTGLEAAHNLRDSQVLVVDRATWAEANLQGFAALLAPALQKLQADHPEQYRRAATTLNATLMGVQAGGIMALLGGKVLGQYDPFSALPDPVTGVPVGPAGGRLMLVAPNVMQVREDLRVRATDFRLWVCLHEQTHRVQFAAAPWLRTYLQEQITALLTNLFAQSSTVTENLTHGLSDMLSKNTDDAAAEPGSTGSLLDAVTSEEDRERLSRITAVMSLLEGHANHVMDAVDRTVIPTVKTIRRRFNDRGKNASVLTKLIRRLLGMDAKARQYRDGQKFTDYAVKELGMAGFNRVWEAPENLPTEHELHHPQEWVDRMLTRLQATQQ